MLGIQPEIAMLEALLKLDMPDILNFIGHVHQPEFHQFVHLKPCAEAEIRKRQMDINIQQQQLAETALAVAISARNTSLILGVISIAVSVLALIVAILK